MLITYIARQVQDMKHKTEVLKKREREKRKDFVIETSVKRFDWTL